MESVNNFLLLKITPPYCIGVEKVCVPGGRRGTRWNVLLRKVSCWFPECGGAQGENIIFYWLYCIQYTYSPIPPEQIDIFESWHHQHPDPTGSKGGGGTTRIRLEISGRFLADLNLLFMSSSKEEGLFSSTKYCFTVLY